MRRSRLNLGALRPGSRTGEHSSGALSRRDLLGITGGAALGASPALRAVTSVLKAPFEMVHDAHRVTFTLGARERWIIDTRRFAGTPVLAVERTEKSIDIRLSGARYPGTELTADFICRLRPSITGWQMSMKMALGHFSAATPFEQWLMGRVAAKSRFRLSPSSVPLGDGVRLALAGPGEAEFRPNWTLRVRGHRAGELHSLGTVLKSSDVTLSLLDPGTPSILSRAPGRRTGFLLERHALSWSVDLPEGTSQGWSLLSTGPVFDRITVEVGETRMGGVRAGLLAESESSEPTLSFQIDHVGGSAKAEPFRLPLMQPTYAIAFGRGGRETALSAGFGDPVWLHVAGCGMQVGAGRNAEPFLLREQDGDLSLRCAPALFALATPLSGAVVEASPVETGQRAVIVTDLKDAPYVNHTANRARIVLHKDHGFRPHAVIAGPIVSVTRPQDLLVLSFGFQNLDLNLATGQAPTLTVHDASQLAYVGVLFPPQHIVEQASHQETSPFPTGTISPFIQGWAARPSQLVFKVPGSSPAIPFTLQSLLDWNRWSLSTTEYAVNANLAPASHDNTRFPFWNHPAQPKGTETALALPYRVVLSPPATLSADALPAFTHSPSEVTHNGRTELWHTRYAARSVADGTIQEGPSDSRLTVRAVWSPDYPTPASSTSDDPAYVPASSPGTAYDIPGFTAGDNRRDLVTLSADFSGWSDDELAFLPDFYYPAPLNVKRLMLSSLGAWLDMNGTWYKPPISLTAWASKGTMGRDHYVKIVRRGFLFPFGHLAAQVTVTQREIVEFNLSVGRRRFAYLIERTFVVLLQHEKTYAPSDFPSGWGSRTPASLAREMPFQRVRITTDATPPITPKDVPIGNGVVDSAYWIESQGAHFPFHVIADDMEGKTIEFGAPAIFVQDVSGIPTDFNAMTAASLAYSLDAGSTVDLAGQTMLIAENSPLTTLAKDQNLEGINLKFKANIPPAGTLLPKGQPGYYPAFDVATVHIPSVKHLVGQGTNTNVKLNQTYLDHGLDPTQNVGQVFADLPTTLPLTYGGSGQAPVSPGIITPNLAISALSATAGPIGGTPSAFAGGGFQPQDFFGGLLGNNSPTILGSIKLSDILGGVTGLGDPAALLSKVPQLVQQTLPDRVVTTLTWTSDLQPHGPFTPGSGSQLRIVGTSTVFLNGAAPSFEITGAIGPFTLSLLSASPVIVVPFNNFTFHIKNGQKMEVTPNLGNVTFRAPLNFVQTLEDFLGSVLGGGTYIDTQPTSVTAGFKILVPSIGTGFFDILNIALGAGVTIPFTGDPVRLRFDFSTKEHPFTVAVLLLGGGGFFSLAIGADGIEAMDAALEVGGIFAIDLVIASGEIHAMMGVYFHWDKDDLSLTGYIRLGGEVSVMGLISVGIEFNLSLTYDVTHSDLYGRAELSIEVSIAFFSTTFSATIEKRIAGAASSSPTPALSEYKRRAHALVAPPTVGDAVTQADWTSYCGAFA